MRLFGRLIAAYIEQNNDEFGMIFNKSLSAYKVHILKMNESDKINELTEYLIQKLEDYNISYLINDRKVRNGVKFMEADMFGLSNQIILGNKNAENNMIELKDRKKVNVFCLK